MKHPSVGFPKLRIAFLLCLGVVAKSAAQPAATPPATQAGEQEEAPLVLSVFVVTTEGDRGYLSTTAASASRINTPVKDIPQAIFVVNQELIRDQAPLTLNDILRFTPNVNVTESFGETVGIRGFAVGVPLINGFRDPRAFPSEQAQIERVEVLAGSASVLYGNVFGVGGVMNRVTKKPLFSPRTSLQLQFADQEATWRAVFDTTGPFRDSSKLAYRLIAVGQKADLLQDFSRLDRASIFPSVTYRFGPQTTLHVETEFTLQSASVGLVNGSRRTYVLNDRFIDVPDHANPEADFVDSDLTKLGSVITLLAKPSEHWSLRVAGAAIWTQGQRNDPKVAPRINADGRTINRNNGGNLDMINRGVGNFFVQADAAGDFDLGAVRFKPVVGLELSEDIDGSYIARATTPLPAFDFFTPDYSAPFPAAYTPFRKFETHTHQWAGFGLLQFHFLNDRLIVNGGARLTDFRQTSRQRGTARRVLNGESAVVPRYGAVFRATRDINFYYSYSEGFQVVTQVNPDGSTLPPIAGQQHEAGVKAAFSDSRFVATAAVYRLDRVNQPQADPIRTGYQIPSGSERSEGFDLSLVATLLDNWQAIAGYSHVEGEIINSATASLVGTERAGLPRNFYNLWTRYRVQRGPAKGLALGLGTNFVDDRALRVATATVPALTIPSYQTYDAMLSYDWDKKTRLQLNLRNFTNERYYPDGNVNSVTVGSPRTFSITVTREF